MKVKDFAEFVRKFNPELEVLVGTISGPAEISSIEYDDHGLVIYVNPWCQMLRGKNGQEKGHQGQA